MSEDRPEERPFSGFSQGSEYEGALQDGKYYPARLIGLKERYIKQGQWPGWKTIWGFDISLGGEVERLEAMTSSATGEGSKAGDWLTALLGAARLAEHRTTRPIEQSEIANRDCKVLIGFNDKGWPRISAVFPPETVSPSPQPAQGASSPAPAPTYTADDFSELPF